MKQILSPKVGEWVKYNEGDWLVIDTYTTGDARSDWKVLVIQGKLSMAVIHINWWEASIPNASLV